MMKQPKIMRLAVAASIFLTCGPLTAAAQVINAGVSSAVRPVGAFKVPALSAGRATVSAAQSTGLNTSLIPSAAPTALTVTLSAAMTPEIPGEARVVRTPGPAATHVADEAAAYADGDEVVPAALRSSPVRPAGEVKKGLSARISALFTRRNAAEIRFDGEATKAPSIFARMGLLPHKPVLLPNRSRTDELPTTPSPEREPTTSVEAYAPGGLDTGGVQTGRKVLEADPGNTDSIVAAVRAMIDADPARYGVASADLRLIGATPMEGRGDQADSVFILFNQMKNGLLINQASYSFTVMIIDGKPTVVAQSGKVFPQLDVNTDTVLSNDEIMGKIIERTGVPAERASDVFQFFEEKIVYARGQWRHVKLYTAEGLPVLIAVDVVTGLVFAWDNRSGLQSPSAPAAPAAGAVSGTATGRAVDKGPILRDSTITEIPLPYLEVKINGKSYVTDKDGRFSTEALQEIGKDGLQLTSALSGPWVRLENQEGRTISISISVKAGDNQVVFNPGASDENTLAQINAFNKVNNSLAFLRDRKLVPEKMAKIQLPVRTNIDDQCNAYYTPGRPTLNFFRSSDNCVNSAYDTVAEHENGHFWDDFTPGGIVNGGLSEGWGDILSMFRLNNPVIGEHFLKRSRGGVDYIRHGENTYQYNEYDEVHDQGQAWGGFAWKLRKALMLKLGDTEGAAVAESLVLPTMFAKATTIPGAMAQVLINATKKDGGILHEEEIRAAAKAHGIDLPNNAAPPASPASWLSVKLKSALPTEGAQGVAPEAAGAEAAPAESEGGAVITFSAGRLVTADALRHVRGYLDHYGVTYKLTRVSSGGTSSTYKLEITGSKQRGFSRPVENLIRTLEDGNLGY